MLKSVEPMLYEAITLPIFNPEESDELDELLIKRVIGLPGDHIEIVDGVVSVNGERLNEDYVKNNKQYTGVFDVPENKLFFLLENGDQAAIIENERLAEIKLKNLSLEYKENVVYLSQEIGTGNVNERVIRNIVKDM